MGVLAVGLLLVSLLAPVPASAWPGDLDPGFGVDGKVVTDLGAADQAHAAVLQPDGKIVAVGESGTSSGRSFAVVRYEVDGSLDASFGVGGTVLTPIGAYASANAVALQPDGAIVVAGYTSNGSVADFALARYGADGALDATFGIGGIVQTPFAASSVATAVAVQPDGRIVAAGETGAADFALARYEADGSLDATFGTSGTVVTDLGTSYEIIHAVALQPDGRIVVGGLSNGRFALARYQTDGTLDPTFGTAGSVVIDVGTNTNAAADGVMAVALMPDGRILVGGSTNYPTVFALARFAADGTLDGTFGNGGIVATPLGLPGSNVPQSRITSLAILPDDAILAVGPVVLTDQARFGIVRYGSDGTLDTTFAPCVLATTDFGFRDGAPATVLVQPDGRVIAAGTAGSLGANANFALAGYLGVGAPSACVPAASHQSIVKASAQNPGHRSHVAFKWNWISTGPIDLADFGALTTHTDLTLCVLDGAGGAFRTSATASSDCSLLSQPSCWRTFRNGYSLKVVEALGLTALRITTKKSSGQVMIRATSKGFAAPLTSLAVPVTVRLHRDDGPQCWEATYSAPSGSSSFVFVSHSD